MEPECWIIPTLKSYHKILCCSVTRRIFVDNKKMTNVGMLGKKSLRAASRALSNCISIFSHISSLVWWWHKTKITSAHEIYFLSCWEGFHFLVRKFRLTPFESLEALFATFEYTASILWRIRGNKEWGALMRWKHLTLTHSRCRGWLEFVNWYLVSRYKWLCFSTFPPCRRSTISTCTMSPHVRHFQAFYEIWNAEKIPHLSQ